MTTTWKELTEPVKIVISAGISGLTTLGATLVFIFTNFAPADETARILEDLAQYETVQNAESWRYQHNLQETCRTVAEIRIAAAKAIRELQARQQFDRDLSDQDRLFIAGQIRDIKAERDSEIQKIDPENRCARPG